MLIGANGEQNEIIQVDQNAEGGSGYVLVADRELAAILGGHVDRDTVSPSIIEYNLCILYVYMRCDLIS